MMVRIMREHARLIMLRALAGEANGALNSAALQDHLQLFGIAKPREWVHEELRWLADIGAIAVSEIETVRIAVITRKGLDHVERRIVIDGIKRPSPAEG